MRIKWNLCKFDQDSELIKQTSLKLIPFLGLPLKIGNFI